MTPSQFPEALVSEAKARNDPVAKYITKLNLASNSFTISLAFVGISLD
jgi:hypothetical protein